MSPKTIRISHNTEQKDLDALVGTKISQMYSKYSGPMGYTIINPNDVVESVEVVSGSVVMQFVAHPQVTLARQAVMVYDEVETEEEEKHVEKNTNL